MLNKDTDLWVTILILMVSGLLSLFLTACPPAAAVCIHLQTQCADNVAQVCNTHQQWETITDCAAVEGDTIFTCQENIEGDEVSHACLPEVTP